MALQILQKKLLASKEKKLPIIRSLTQENIGIPKNFLKVVSMSNSEFVWLIGDDDLPALSEYF